MLKSGDRVVCIDDKFPKEVLHLFKEFPVQGREYTIRSTRNSTNGWFGVLLQEIKNPSIEVPVLLGKAEPGFAEWRFKNLDEVYEESEHYSEALQLN